MKILLVAEEAAGAKTIPLIIKSGHTLVSVLTKMDTELKSAPIKTTAAAAKIPLMDAQKVTDPSFADWISYNGIDVLINVHSLYVICPQVIQALKVGAFNLHPGKLPEYAGLNAPSWSIYYQEPEHSVTLHQITEQVDAGAIIYETTFPIDTSETALTVSLKCIQHGLLLIEQLLEALHQAPLKLPRKAQNPLERRYFKKNEIPNNGMIIWKNTATAIDAFIRACNYAPFKSPWNFPKTKIGNRVISISKARHSHEVCSAPPGMVGYTKNGQIAVATNDQWIIVERLLVGDNHLRADSILSKGDMLQ